MAKIKNLHVKVSYSVWLSDVDVSDDVCKSMESMFAHGSACDDDLRPDSIEASYEWIADNINDDDAISFEIEIEELEI